MKILKSIPYSFCLLVNFCMRHRSSVAAFLLAISALLWAKALWNEASGSLLFYHTDNMSRFSCNIVGQLATLSRYFFGGGSFVIVALLLLSSLIVATTSSWRSQFDRFIVLVGVLFITSGLLSIYAFDPYYAICPGGYCGTTICSRMLALYDKRAATGILVALLSAAIIIIGRFPFIMLYSCTQHIARFLSRSEYLVALAYRLLSRIIRYAGFPLIVTFRWARLWLVDMHIDGDKMLRLFGYSADEHESYDASCDEFWKSYCNTLSDCQDELNNEYFDKSGTKPFGTAQELSFEKERKVQENETISYMLPSSDIFIDHDEQQNEKLTSELDGRARILEEKLERFGVCGKVVAIKQGPVVTLFEYEPHIDTKLSKIIALEDDLAMALQALSIRIIAPIPGKALVGFEVSNNKRRDVLFGSIIQSKKFRGSTYHLPLVLGCDTVGKDVVIDLAKMPHLLVAGSTGSGKSVALNAMLVSLLCHCTPDELRLILIDPKRLEFASYEDMGHLIFPIITDPKQAILALRWAVKEMEERYEIMKKVGARNMIDYNSLAQKKGIEKLPFIMIIIDELSDLMITAGRDIESLIVRITQMARAAGIHMLVATQRPSVDVITGLIKVNFPSRISFRVTSKVDSRTILDCAGAEKLLGRGDMLFLDAGSSRLHRVHGAYVSDSEIEQLVTHIKAQREPHYYELSEQYTGSVGLSDADDQLYNDIIKFLDGVDEISISLLQRRFRIGYNRSARIIEMLETEGIIAPSDGSKMRKVIR